jgi:acetyl-CoA acyltransferase
VNLLAAVLKDLIARNGIDVNEIDDVIAGCVTQAGDQSVNIARSAARLAPESEGP